MKRWREAAVALAVALLATFGVYENARAAHRGAITACNAVHDSNVKTVDVLRKALVAGPNHDRAEAFVDHLAAGYEDVYRACLSKAP